LFFLKIQIFIYALGLGFTFGAGTDQGLEPGLVFGFVPGLVSGLVPGFGIVVGCGII